MNFFKRKYYRFLVNYLEKREADDVKYLKILYYLKNERELNLENPKEFTEKIQWLKLYKYTERYKEYADKYAVRQLVAQKAGDDILNELYGVYNSVEEIDIDALPQQFVLKCTHASGTNIIVKDKSKLNWPKAKAKLQQWMQLNQYYKNREKVYKDITPRIIAEKYLSEADEDLLIDYKFYCFNGVPHYVLVKLTENGDEKKCYYTMDWQKVHPEKEPRNFLKRDMPKPENFDEMVRIAKILSEGFIFIRVDLYSLQGKIYFGELTFFPTGGIKRIAVEWMNEKLGDLIQLPA
jgi:hypothetical protein